MTIVYLLFFFIACVLRTNEGQLYMDLFAGGAQTSDLTVTRKATAVSLNTPRGIFGDTKGNIYFADAGNIAFRKVNASRYINLLGGTGPPQPSPPLSATNQPFTATPVYYPMFITGDTLGNFLYMTDQYHVWKYNLNTKAVTGISGSHLRSGSAGDGQDAINGVYSNLQGIWLNSIGELFLCDPGDHVIRKIGTDNILSRFAGIYGTSNSQYADYVRATSSSLHGPTSVWVDSKGTVYIADTDNNRIRTVNTTLIIKTFAGGGTTGSNKPATLAALSNPLDVKGDPYGNIYIADQGSYYIRMVDTAGIIYNLLGNGAQASTTSFVPATSGVGSVSGIWVDSNSNVYFSASDTSVIRRTVGGPTSQPTNQPTGQPSSQPSRQPTGKPTVFLGGSSSSLKNGLVAFYPFDGDADDNSGNGNHGAIRGNLTFTTDRYNHARTSANFDGHTAYIVIPGGQFNFPMNFSFSLWVYPRSQLPYSTILDKTVYTGSVISGTFILQQNNATSNQYRFFMATARGGSLNAAHNFQLITNQWQHFVVVKKDSLLIVYLNGAVLFTLPTSANNLYNNGNLPLLLGGLNYGRTLAANTVVDQFNGKLDDVFFYNRTLTASEVSLLYNFQTPTSQPSTQPSQRPTMNPTVRFPLASTIDDGLVAYYPLDGNANDDSGNGNTGIIRGASNSVPDRFNTPGRAFSFNGVSTYIEIPGAQFNFACNLSIAVWIKPNSNQNALNYLISKFDTAVSNSGWYIRQGATTNQYAFTSYPPSGIPQTTSLATFQDGVWQHYAFVRGPKQYVHFLNGVPTATSTSLLNIAANTKTLLVGGAHTGVAVTGLFTGRMSDLFIYNRTLSANEVVLLADFKAPTSQPSTQPTRSPSSQPSQQPNSSPTAQPSRQPTRQPTGQPSGNPTTNPTVFMGGAASALKNGLVAYYPFNGDNKDDSGNGNNGIRYGTGNLFSADRFAKPNAAANFNGLDDYLEFAGEPFNFANNMTIAVWVYPLLLNGLFVVDKSSRDPTQASNHRAVGPFKILGTSTGFALHLTCASNPGSFLNTIQVNVNTNLWSHLAFAKQGNTVNKYLNGALVDSFTACTQLVANGNYPLVLGATNIDYTIPASPASYFSGLMDDLFFFNRSLSTNEILLLSRFDVPSSQPTGQPSVQPSRQPTGRPTGQPTRQPSGQPTMQPASLPSGQPTRAPSTQPTRQPTTQPTRQPSSQPTTRPTAQPTCQPSSQPTRQPTSRPSRQPTAQPSSRPTTQPSRQPSTQPSRQPTSFPTLFIGDSSSSLKAGLIAYYPFDGNAFDHSGNGNNGVLRGSLRYTTDNEGIANHAAKFDGTSAYIEVPGHQFNFVNNMSISLWVKPGAVQGSQACIASNEDSTSASNGWSLRQLSTSTNTYSFKVEVNGIPSGYQLTAKTWNHFAVVKTGSNAVFYVNGVANPRPNVYATAAFIANDLTLIIGATHASNGQSISRYFNGSMNDAFFYNRSLSADEIIRLYNFKAPTSQPTGQPSLRPTMVPTTYFGPVTSLLKNGLVAYYPFDGSANDASGNGNSGAIRGGVTFITNRLGNAGSAMRLDGSSGYIEIPGQQFNFPANMSISLWFTYDLATNTMTLLDKTHGTSSAGFSGFFMRKAPAANTVFFRYLCGSSCIFPTSTSASVITLPAGGWVHLVITKAGPVLTAYANGQQVVSFTALSSTATIVPNGNLPLIIGAANEGYSSPATAMAKFYRGDVDELFIYNRTLSAEEIVQLYNFEAPTSQPSSSPSTQPSADPSTLPTTQPSAQPSNQPSQRPTINPTVYFGGISSVLKDGVVAFYPLNGGANDDSGNGNSGVIYGGVTPQFDRFGNEQSAVEFDGTGYIEIPGREFNFAQNMSISFWLNPVASQSSCPATIFDKSSLASPESRASWSVLQSCTDPHTFHFEYFVSGNALPIAIADINITTNQWSHWVMIKEGSITTYYINGQLKVREDVGRHSSTMLTNGHFPLIIGGFNLGGTDPASGAGNTYQGLLDDIFIYNRSLTNIELQLLYDFRAPSSQPTAMPSSLPSRQPTGQPSVKPTNQPSSYPSVIPSEQPTGNPSGQPSSRPSAPPTALPTMRPTGQPTTRPTAQPVLRPTSVPSSQPSNRPSVRPSSPPSTHPSSEPSASPTGLPSGQPTGQPSTVPTRIPTSRPTEEPSSRPSAVPTPQPTNRPSAQPSSKPSKSPSSQPSMVPSAQPSTAPTRTPSAIPSSIPSGRPSSRPSRRPSSQPSSEPSSSPTVQPVSRPTSVPSGRPSNQPSARPSSHPTAQPSRQPTARPSNRPSVSPTSYPSQRTKAPSSKDTLHFPSLSVLTTSLTTFKQVNYLFGAKIIGKAYRDIVVPSGSKAGDSYLILGSRGFPQEFLVDDIHVPNVQSLLIQSPQGLSIDNKGSRAIDFGGDFNRDRLSDLLIGDPSSSQFYILYSHRNQPWTNLTEGLLFKGSVSSSSSSSGLGWALSSAGDYNSDGTEDMIVSAVYSSRCYIVMGRSINSNGTSIPIELYLAGGTSRGIILEATGSTVFVAFGAAVSKAGDFNGDGIDDVAVSAIGGSGANFIYILYGQRQFASSKISLTSSSASLPSSVGMMISAPVYSFAGLSLAGFSDVNGDGLGDVLIGSVPFNKGYTTQISYLIYGRASSSSPVQLGNLTRKGGVVMRGGGIVVSNVGDVNGDGMQDMMLSSLQNWQGKSGSYVLNYPGRFISSIPTIQPSLIPVTASPSFSPTSMPSQAPTSLRITAIPTTEHPTVIQEDDDFDKTGAPLVTPRPTVNNRTTPVPTFIRTRKPSIAPTRHPTRIPTITPSRVPTRIPSKSPTIRPSVGPSKIPTRVPSYRPTQTCSPTSLPSSQPSLSASSQGRTVPISSGGNYRGANGNETFLIEAGTNSQWLHGNVALIEGGQGAKHYIISPSLLTANGGNSTITITITDFEASKDLIDFSLLSSTIRFSYEVPPLTLILLSVDASAETNRIEIILSSHEDYDLFARNLIFPASSSQSSTSSSSSSTKTDSSVTDFLNSTFTPSVITIILISVLITVLSFFLMNRGKWKQKTREAGFPLVKTAQGKGQEKSDGKSENDDEPGESDSDASAYDQVSFSYTQSIEHSSNSSSNEDEIEASKSRLAGVNEEAASSFTPENEDDDDDDDDAYSDRDFSSEGYDEMLSFASNHVEVNGSERPLNDKSRLPVSLAPQTSQVAQPEQGEIDSSNDEDEDEEDSSSNDSNDGDSGDSNVSTLDGMFSDFHD